MNTLNLLIIEDNASDYFIITRKLKKEVDALTSTRIESPQELKDALATETYDAILSDNKLPEMDALEALAITRAINKDIPFIIVSGAIAEEKAAKAMLTGANDYILKDKIDRLIPALLRELKEARYRKKQQQADKDLQAYIYRISHDLKGPLAGIQGLVEVIEQSDDIELIQESISYLRLGTSQMEVAIHQLLEMFKIKETKVIVKTISPVALIKEVWEGLKHIIDQDEVDFVCNHDGDYKLETDPALLQSVFQNILENAVKYRDKSRKCELTVHTSMIEERLNISFKDNGVGIHEEFQATVFDMFIRGNETANGSGLGLYVTQNAVEKLDGKITLTSIRGEGTTFHINLPVLTKRELEKYISER